MSAPISDHPGLRPAGALPPADFFRAIEIIADRRPAPSTRVYRVLPSVPADHPLLADGSATAALCITIVRIDGEKMILPSAWPWADTDAWASWRWRKAVADRRAHLDGEGCP